MLLSKSFSVICLLTLGFMLSLSSCSILHQSQVVKSKPVDAAAAASKATEKVVSVPEKDESATSASVRDSARGGEGDATMVRPTRSANEDLFPANALPPVDRSGLRTPSLPRILPMDLDGRLLPKEAQ